MKKNIVFLFAITLLFSACKKLDEFEGNNVVYEETPFELEEKVTLIVPNSSFNFGGIGNCISLGILGPINFEAFVATQNPNPYAVLVHEMKPSIIQMDLTNIPDCDFGMLEDVVVYLTDSSVTSFSQFILQNPNNPTSPHNAVKLGEFIVPSTYSSSTIYLDVNTNAVLDQFIHAGNFNTYTNMNFDKAFTESEAIIKTTMTLSVKLINENN